MFTAPTVAGQRFQIRFGVQTSPLDFVGPVHNVRTVSTQTDITSVSEQLRLNYRCEAGVRAPSIPNQSWGGADL